MRTLARCELTPALLAAFSRPAQAAAPWVPQEDIRWEVASWRLKSSNPAGFRPITAGTSWISGSGAAGRHVVAAADFDGNGLPDLTQRNGGTG